MTDMGAISVQRHAKDSRAIVQVGSVITLIVGALSTNSFAATASAPVANSNQFALHCIGSTDTFNGGQAISQPFDLTWTFDLGLGKVAAVKKDGTVNPAFDVVATPTLLKAGVDENGGIIINRSTGQFASQSHIPLMAPEITTGHCDKVPYVALSTPKF